MKKQHIRKMYFFVVGIASVVVGLFIGAMIREDNSWKSREVHKQAKKFKQVLSYVSDHYVDEIDLERFTEKAIQAAINTLDPHSSYRPAEEAVWQKSLLQGEYKGLGIEFQVFLDTVYIRRIIPGGPAEQAGLRAGDQILCINDQNLRTKGQDSHLDLIKKEKNLKSITIQRAKEQLSIPISRAEVPLSTIGAAYMLSEGLAYTRIEWFSPETDEELIDTLNVLKKRGMKKLILDLRNNTGGYIRAAINIADEFLPKGKVIIRTASHHPKKKGKTYKSKKEGTYQQLPLIILMDRATASASEILIGALQDHRRALLIGERSYGKALLQEFMPLVDGGELLLTVSRYYTPKGSSIQRPYVLESAPDTVEAKNRAKSNPGGLSADISVTADSLNTWLSLYYEKGILQAYARIYYLGAYHRLSAISLPMDIATLLEKNPINKEQFYQLCDSCERLPPTRAADRILAQHLAQELAYMKWGEWGRQQLKSPTDPYILQALKSWKKAENLLLKPSPGP